MYYVSEYFRFGERPPPELGNAVSPMNLILLSSFERILTFAGGDRAAASLREI